LSDQAPPPVPPEPQQIQQSAYDRAMTKQNNLLGNLNFRAAVLEEQLEDANQKIAQQAETIRLLEAQLAPFLGIEQEPEEGTSQKNQAPEAGGENQQPPTVPEPEPNLPKIDQVEEKV
jgi:hypothetical protein